MRGLPRVLCALAAFGLACAAPPPPEPATLAVRYAGSGPALPAPEPSTGRVLVLLDATPSMTARDAAGLTALESARAAAERFLVSLPQEIAASVYALGTGEAACGGPRPLLELPVGAPPASALGSLQGAQSRSEGSLARALLTLAEAAAGDPAPPPIVAFTDLDDACGSDVCAAAEALARRGIPLHLVRVGSGAVPACLEADFAAPAGLPMQEAPPPPAFRVEPLSDPTAAIVRGRANGAPVPVPAGPARVVVELDPPLEMDPLLLAPGARVRVDVVDFPDTETPVRDWRVVDETREGAP